MFTTTVAHLFTVCVAIAILFQMALICGAPWGHLAMGGRYPGRFPVALRVAALVQALLLACFGLVVETKVRTVLPEYHSFASKGIWAVVAVSAISLAMNLVTRSRWERILWAPLALVMLVTSTWVALNGGA